MREKLHFYLLRLRNSSLPELIYRAKQFYFLKKLKRQISKNTNPVAVLKIDYEDIKNLRLPSFHGNASNSLVQIILKGELFTLNTDIAAIRKFEKDQCHKFFADIKLSERQPDIRAVWEPARLQHLVLLLQCLSQIKVPSDTQLIRQFVKNSVAGWIRENPFLYGPHYTSAMECGLRVPVFFYCLSSLGNPDLPEYQLILDAIYRHGWWISKRLSLHSSLGNHTIAECVGLIFAGAIFRNTGKGLEWLKTGRKLLKQELSHQILEDGGPAEHSLNYHRFVSDLYWLAIDFLEKNNLYECSEFKERLNQAEHFLTAFRHTSNSLPSIGDSDDGYAVATGLYPRRIQPSKKNEEIQTFLTSGYTIINRNDVVLTFDHGPLGMAPLYNHGHADALSITLSVSGKEMLVDPGTYRYNGEPEFRKYFKGTRAHNTVTIDGLDQAVQETGFIWSRPYKAKLLKREEINGGVFLRADHDGYLRIKDPVRHFRSIISFDEEIFFVKDTFSGRGVHSFELNYHVHPGSQITSKNHGWWKINHQETVIFVRLLNENSFSVIKGQKDPLFGWYSPSYGAKCESGVLSCMMRGTPKEVSFITTICIHSPKEMNT
jgi:Heparinase II/III-like protein/Heparinase II/III N-terminus